MQLTIEEKAPIKLVMRIEISVPLHLIFEK